jgi:putative selenate reductase
MSAFVPHRFPELLGWALDGLERERGVYGLPQRSFWQPKAGLDFSVPVVGGRAETPLGPAAGPHTQLAHNLVIAWLAGARLLELKTVQILDRLEIPRPCIDAPAEGYNVEWSQELRLEQSLEQYVAAWLMIHALAARGCAGPAAAASVRAGNGLPGTRFDASVGYDLAGVRSAPVAAFLDGLADASAVLDALRASVPAARRGAVDVAVPSRVAGTVTVSTFHGCPPEEIEQLVEHLFDRHRLHVVVKLNPTLLGHDAVAHELHDVLGRRDLVLDPEAFDRDLQWEQAVGMLTRLATVAARRGLALGVKLTNTLVVRNTRGRLSGERVYLSGAPLRPLALALGARLAASPIAHLPRSFSAGVNAENFADTVAAGFAPVTVCTDLLRPTGYRRLPRYLKALAAEFERTGSHDVAGYVVARRREASGAGGARPGVVAGPGAADAEPAAPSESETRPPLELLDCQACNRCVLACPNGAFFAVPFAPRRVATPQLVAGAEGLEQRPTLLETRAESQWLLDAGLCNACGNCDTWCPQTGGPWRVKPRLHRTRTAYLAEAPADGILIEAEGERILARFGGVEHRLERRDGGWEFGNDTATAWIDDQGSLRDTRLVEAGRGHTLDLAHAIALRDLVAATLAGLNPVSAART